MANSELKVSIITVVYNGVNTIEQTIKSVLGQTYKNIEYIIIDGASTDGTQQIIKKYVDYISYYVSERDDGLYYAMNRGIEKATGEIIGIINSDDWYSEDAVESVVDCFRQNAIDLVYGRIIKILENGEEKIRKNMPLKSMWYQMAIPHPSVFVKRDIYQDLGIFDTRYQFAADYELLLRFYTNKIKFYYLDKVLAYFRLGGITTTERKKIYDDGYKISMAYINKCPYKDEILPKISEIYEWECFVEEISHVKGVLYRLLCEYFATSVNRIIIFGAGIWGKTCYKNLVDAEIKIIYFTDNDMSKWDTDFQGTKVISPDKLQNTDVPVLIAVKEHGEEIKRQLENIGNAKLKCVTIVELATMYCKDTYERK